MAAGEAEPEPAIVADGVGLTYPGGVTALRDVTLSVRRGEFVSIVGPSGCGKSTLLKAIAGLQKITSGSLKVSTGNGPGAADRRAGVLSFVFQGPTLLPWRSVRGNVALPMELRGTRPSEYRSRVDDLLKLVGLSDFAERFPMELSGGMQMRVSLARALITDPSILLLDEPFGALDDLTRQKLNDDLRRIWLQSRWTGVFVTHNVQEAVFLSTRVLVMSPRPGTVVADLEVDLPEKRTPELRVDMRFGELVRRVRSELREG